LTNVLERETGARNSGQAARRRQWLDPEHPCGSV